MFNKKFASPALKRAAKDAGFDNFEWEPYGGGDEPNAVIALIKDARKDVRKKITRQELEVAEQAIRLGY
jgi:hypothetical protein